MGEGSAGAQAVPLAPLPKAAVGQCVPPQHEERAACEAQCLEARVVYGGLFSESACCCLLLLMESSGAFFGCWELLKVCADWVQHMC